MTDGNGNFTLDVNTGTNWNITARSPNGKYGSVTGKSAGATNVSIVLSQTRNDFIQKDPFAANVDATQPQSLTTSFAQVNADAGTFGSDTNTSVNMKKETSVPTTANKEAVAGIGVEVDATDSSNSSITTLQNNAVVHVTYDKAQIDASLQSGQINKASDLQNALLSYYDSVNSTWNTLNGNKLSIKVQATAGADYTVMDTDSFFADFTNQDKNDNDFILDWQGTTNHLTLFAPVISAAPTPVTPNNNQNNNQNNNNNQNQNPAPSFSGSSGSAGNTNDQTKPLPKTTTKTTPHFKGAADDSSYTTPAGSDYKNNFAEKYINRLFATKAVSGCSKNNFCPNNKITRAEFIKVLLNVMGTTIVKNQSVIFKDISTHWAKDYILTAAKLGIIKGYADGTFKPDLPVTRAEALKMVFSAFNSTLVKTTAKPVNNLADTDQSQWFYKYAVAATNNGMIKLASDGKGKTYLKPSQPLTRAEMAQLVIMVKDTTNTTTATTSNSTTQSATQQTIQTQNTK